MTLKEAIDQSKMPAVCHLREECNEMDCDDYDFAIEIARKTGYIVKENDMTTGVIWKYTVYHSIFL